jgi:adenosylmethionine-8-amino-7-oxononanoate aminotransferase
MGRTGSMFAFEHSGAVPDMLVLGKALTAGYAPLSAVLVRASADPYASWSAGDPTHLHTLAGNAVGCAAAMATLDVFERDSVPANSLVRGRQLVADLEAALRGDPRVVGIRGRGLDPGPREPKVVERSVIRRCAERGLLVQGSSGPYCVIVLHPPLIIGSLEVDRAVSGLASVLTALDA